MDKALLGGIGPATFLRRYWQKQALLVRQAIPGFRGCASTDRLLALACRDDIESRLVVRSRGHWSLTHGPFRARDFASLPARGWTLLVQGVNLHWRDADTLLRRFAFIPYARLDDLMVSYAAPGGGVGPHFDSYDVFLLQGSGRRRWRLGRQRDLSLKADLPLKILARFKPNAECMLAPGDMLYLPPGYAHDGVAIDACTTYSIGFRAPGAQELATAFLDWLRDSIDFEGQYADPGLAPAKEPARISSAMRAQCAVMLQALRWHESTVARFVGSYVTEPKSNVTFRPPRRPLAAAAFAASAMRGGVRLNSRTQLLYDERHLFINGTAVSWPKGVAALKRLANARRLAATDIDGKNLLRMLYQWYRDGFLHFS